MILIKLCNIPAYYVWCLCKCAILLRMCEYIERKCRVTVCMIVSAAVLSEDRWYGAMQPSRLGAIILSAETGSYQMWIHFLKFCKNKIVPGDYIDREGSVIFVFFFCHISDWFTQNYLKKSWVDKRKISYFSWPLGFLNLLPLDLVFVSYLS